MEVKTFEVRDAGTFIPCIAIRLNPATEKDRYLIGRAGYGQSAEEQGEYVIFGRLEAESEFHFDAFAWGNRTMQTAHHHVSTHFDALESGALVDVQFLKGETSEPKVSEMQEYQSSPLKMARHFAVEHAIIESEMYVQDEGKQ